MIQMAAHVTEAEGKILNVLWERSPMTITQITAALRDVTGWDKHAVISRLKRMLEKGSVRMELSLIHIYPGSGPALRA